MVIIVASRMLDAPKSRRSKIGHPNRHVENTIDGNSHSALQHDLKWMKRLCTKKFLDIIFGHHADEYTTWPQALQHGVPKSMGDRQTFSSSVRTPRDLPLWQGEARQGEAQTRETIAPAPRPFQLPRIHINKRAPNA